MALSDLPVGAYIAVALSSILLLCLFFYIFGCVHGCFDIRRRNKRMRSEGIPDLEAAKVTKDPPVRERRTQSQAEEQGTAALEMYSLSQDSRRDGVDEERKRQQQRHVQLEKPPRSLIPRGSEGEYAPSVLRHGQMHSGSEDSLPRMPTLPRPVAQRR